MQLPLLGFFLIALLIMGSALGQPDGRKIYLNHCASCHGDKGQGTEAVSYTHLTLPTKA